MARFVGDRVVVFVGANFRTKGWNSQARCSATELVIDSVLGWLEIEYRVALVNGYRVHEVQRGLEEWSNCMTYLLYVRYLVDFLQIARRILGLAEFEGSSGWLLLFSLKIELAS